MQYGHFDNEKREYVIDRVDVPVSWTNYIGIGDMMGVFNHTAGGYLVYKSSEYHRITRFRPNGVPMDFPGHYVYLRDAEYLEMQAANLPLRRMSDPDDCVGTAMFLCAPASDFLTGNILYPDGGLTAIG